MKIVILDGYTLNPGDLDWSSIAALGEVKIYDRTPLEEVPDRIADAEIVLTNKARLTRDVIINAPSLRYIGVMATGYNVVDVAAARERNIIVANVPAYSTASAAQHTFALLMELTSHVGRHAQSVRDGYWSQHPDFSYWHVPLVELHGNTMGIVGLGKIGQAVARIALAMGMHVVASHKHPRRDRMDGVLFVDQETCFQQADVVSLHCPLNDGNKEFVNSRLLQKMKRSAFLINVSRGALINERDLATALNTGVIAGAGLDVLSEEPPPLTNPLLKAQNCIITPHIAWATQAARSRLMNITAGNIAAFLSGHPVNVV